MDPTEIMKMGFYAVAALTLMGIAVKLWKFEESLAQRMKLYADQSAKPQPIAVQSPLVVTPAPAWATRAELDALIQRIESREKRTEDLIAELRQAHLEQAEKIHTRINDLLGAVSEIRGACLRAARDTQC